MQNPRIRLRVWRGDRWNQFRQEQAKFLQVFACESDIALASAVDLRLRCAQVLMQQRHDAARIGVCRRHLARSAQAAERADCEANDQ